MRVCHNRTDLVDFALAARRHGISTLPVTLPSKTPPRGLTWKNRQAALPSENTIRRELAGGNGNVGLAIICGKVSGDLEVLDFDLGGEFYNQWAELVETESHGLIGRLAIEQTLSGGYHVISRCRQATVPGNTRLAHKRVEVSGPGEHEHRGKKYRAQQRNEGWFICPLAIETRGEGGYCVVSPSPGYTVIQLGGGEDFYDFPVVTASEHEVLIRCAKALDEYPPEPPRDTVPQKGDKPGEGFNAHGEVLPLLLKHGWKQAGQTGERQHLTRPGKERGVSATLYEGKVLHVFSSNALPFEADTSYSPFGIYALLEHGGDFSKAAAVLAKEGFGSVCNIQDDDIQSEPGYRWTDLGNAERLVAEHGRDLKYCYPFGRWLVWDGTRWANDNTGEVKRRCKATIRAMYAEAGRIEYDEKRKALVDYARKCESDHKIKAMLSLARSEEGIPVLPEQLDADPWLLNCLNGTVDLKTGKLLPHRRENLISKVAPWNYDPAAECPCWTAHLNKIMAGDKQLIAFLQRAFGYCLTGDTSERSAFIEWGTGANGKSVTNDTVAMALGDYAMRTPTETLLVKRNEGIPNDVARLKGARFVYAAEAEQGKRLAESLLKDMTGGEKISARFMRGEWFEFEPEFKIWLGTNHKPIISGTDNAIWDRIRLIPFTVRIPDSERQPKSELLDAFKTEMPGILAWLVRGCLEWKKIGLRAPGKVLAATTEYRNEMDTMGDFISECCNIGPTETVTAKAIYERYEQWAEDNGEKTISKKMFGMKLTERGLDSYKASYGIRTWAGIGVK